VQLQRLDGEAVDRVREAKEPVLYDDGRAVFLLRDEAVDRAVSATCGVRLRCCLGCRGMRVVEGSRFSSAIVLSCR
jgi:hypothetical protein